MTIVLLSACSLQISTGAYMAVRTGYTNDLHERAPLATIAAVVLAMVSLTLTLFQGLSQNAWPILFFRKNRLMGRRGRDEIRRRRVPEYFPRSVINYILAKEKEANAQRRRNRT